MRDASLRSYRRFLHDDTGAAALEFALIAPPFFIILIGIIEVGLMFFSATLLEGGVGDASRLVRTGRIQDEADPIAAFRSRLCQNLILVSCDRLVVEVREFSSFAEAGADTPNYRSSTGGGGQAGDLAPRQMQFGTGSSVMVSRVQYRYPFLSPVGMLISGSAENSVLLLSTAVFKNEPYT